MPIYRAIFWFVLIFSNTVIASNDIHFSSPDSNYISGKIDSIIQNSVVEMKSSLEKIREQSLNVL